MRWDDIDWKKGTWTKPSHITKSKIDHTTPLSAPALQLLSKIYDAQKQSGERSDWVFPSHRAAADGHVIDVKQDWPKLCKAAKITGLRVHDLRHSFASQLASSGASLPLIGQLLGHSQPATTARYAHLFDTAQRAAVERVGAIYSGAPAVEPTPLSKKRRK
jgi:integrase